jgi:predicted RNase H-like HicB family nuclease
VDETHEIELVFEPQDEGGYHVYAPDLPGLQTQGDYFDDAMVNANEAVALYVEGLREDDEPLDSGVIRRGTLAGILRDADLSSGSFVSSSVRWLDLRYRPVGATETGRTVTRRSTMII